MGQEQGTQNVTQVTNRKRLPKEKYVALFLKYTYSYPKVDAEGKPVYKTNPVTGQPLNDVDGSPVPIMVMGEFQNVQARMSKGYLSEKVVDPNTDDPQKLAEIEVLRRIAARKDMQVWTEDVHDQKTNPAMFAEKKRRKEMEGELAEYKAKAQRADELEKRLANLENKRK